MKKFILTLVANVLITFAWEFLWNVVLFKETFEALAPSYRETPLFGLGFTTMIIQSIALYILYSKFYKGESPIKESMTLIYLVGVFDIAFASLMDGALFEIEPVGQWILLKGICGIIHFGLVGLALILVFKPKK